MGKLGEGGVEDPVVMGQSAGAIQVKWRAHRRGDFSYWHVFAVEFA